MNKSIPDFKQISLGNGNILLIDGFQHASKASKDTLFFLTHAHSDHYTGINANWNLGPIYCSETTAKLIHHLLGVDPAFLHPLPLNEATTLANGVQVTLVDANHCPGAVQFLFRLPDGRKIVHTGDFRYSPSMLSCPHIEAFKGADVVYLDTTYANPKYKFPAQEVSIEYVAETIHKMLLEDQQSVPSVDAEVNHQEQQGGSSSSQRTKLRRRLFLISTYVIGKERILRAVSERCGGLKIFVSERKAGVMACLPGLPEDLFTNDPFETPVHVVPWGFLGETWPFFRPNWKVPAEYSRDQKAEGYVGFVPTGWVHGMAKTTFPVHSKHGNAVHLVPYSEHSSYDELLEFVGHIRPAKVLPTVRPSGDDAERAMDKLLRRFTLVTNQDAAKAKFIAKMTAANGSGGSSGNQEDLRDCGEEEKHVEVVELLGEDDGDDDGDREEGEDAPAAADWQMLLSLTDGGLTAEQAQQLVQAAHGDISRAADMYFEGSWRSVLAGSSNKNKGNGGKKRSGGVGGSGAGGSAKKRRSDVGVNDAGQRSILSFFGGRSSPSKAIAGGDCKNNEEKLQEEAFMLHQGGEDSKTNVDSSTTVSPEAKKAFQALFKAPQPAAAKPSPPLLPAASLPSPSSTAPAPLFKPSAIRQIPDRSTPSVPRDAVTLPLKQYHPILHAPWSPGQPTPYLHLARTFEAMDSTTKRIAISDALTNAFRSVLALSPEDLASTAYLAVGKIAPDYEQGMELSVGGSLVSTAITEATGVKRTRLREMYNEMGDLGDVAAACKRTQATLARPAPLTVAGVHATLRGIAGERGSGASSRRQAAILGLLRSCREAETKYLVRTLVQNLRVGANWRSVIPALAKAIVINSSQKEALTGISSAQNAPISSSSEISATALPSVPQKSILDAAAAAATVAFHVCPNLDLLIAAMFDGPMESLSLRCRLSPGIPIKPMLAKISQGVADAVAQQKGAAFVAEYKYDGVRAQIHLHREAPGAGKANGTSRPSLAAATAAAAAEASRVQIFSRNCEERTASFPDVAAQILEAAAGGAQSCILDAEVVAIDRSTEPLRLRPFQDLSSRPRGAVDAASLTVDVCVFVFDILELNGESLLGLPLRDRRRKLLEALPGSRPGYVQLAQGFEVQNSSSEESSDGDAEALEKEESAQASGASEQGDDNNSALVARVQVGLQEALAAGTEGLMLKSLDAAYQPSRRSEHWVKLKKDYCDSHETLDLVVIGAWYGNGRKVGWYSPFLLAVYDPETESLQSLCRCMSGFSDEFYKAATARLKETIIPTKRPYYVTNESPDVWFDAKEVWEVRGADLTLSPVHKAAVGRLAGTERGIGLRFPRFIRIRDDKNVEDATSADAIVEMYEAQASRVR